MAGGRAAGAGAARSFLPLPRADTYPARPLAVIVALAAGTGMDTIVRLYGQELSRRAWASPSSSRTVPAPPASPPWRACSRRRPTATRSARRRSSALAIRPALFKKLPYDVLTDFTPVALYLKSPFILVVNPDAAGRAPSPISSATCRERPGQLSFSSSAVGGAPHLAGEYLKQRFAIDMTHVPYRNSPQATADVVAGHIPLTFAEAGVSLPLIREGKLRALAVTSAVPLAALPDVPPLAQAADASDFEAVSWHVLFVRAQTPPEIVGKLHDEMKAILAAPEMSAAIARLGLIAQTPAPVDATRDYMRAELAKWGALVRSLGLEGSQ